MYRIMNKYFHKYDGKEPINNLKSKIKSTDFNFSIIARSKGAWVISWGRFKSSGSTTEKALPLTSTWADTLRRPRICTS